ncbi:CHAT domain-containing protein [Planotetraspora phitsanulokensis]|uniref:CHAT domain-containing protein n=1 Tax=Planotetraspora phitsanulokensis TaxID=575192 RepID=A0A8J3U9J3_9ACTN|nr:CHAT domain-containing protein [Planotetraspora phitsanulokensis]GII41248.1 CHAT domain-containing protein [Planotetraspora phitsanulokensis]
MNTTEADPAKEMLRLAEADPARLTAWAADVTAEARTRGDLLLESVAERALGIAAVHLYDLRTATGHLRAAIRLGRRARSSAVAAEARIRLAFVLSLSGRPHQALREIDTALPDLQGVARARADAQRAAVFNHLGRLGDALACYRAAVPALRRAGDHLWLQRVLSNRAIVHGYRHEFSAAEADLREAQELCQELGLDLSLAIVRLNLGWVSAVHGDIPTALSHLDVAEERFRALGTHQLGWLLIDRSELLLSAGLVAEARAAAEEAVEELQRRNRVIGLPEVRLLLARAAILQGDHERSLQEARRSVVEFGRQRRREWSVLARFVVLRSEALRAPGDPALVGALERSATALAAAHWPASSVEARLLAAQAAFDRGAVARGRRSLEEAAKGRLHGPALLRGRAWQAEALLRMEKGDVRGAATAVRAGLRVLDEHRATLGATDLRAYGSQFRAELAAVGLRMALRDGRPEKVLTWAEQARVSRLLTRPARPPDDPVLAATLTELRATVHEIQDAREAGRDSAHLVRDQISLERRIRDHCRRRPPVRTPAIRPVPVALLRERIGESALIEFFQLADRLHAVSVIAGRLRVESLAPLMPVRDLIDRIPFALRRLTGRVPAASRAAAEAMLRDAAAQLDAMLLGPFMDAVADRPLVVVPSGPLQSLAWSVLPSCSGRAVTVSPSATLWHAAAQVRDAGGHIMAAAGPGLPGARAEAETVASLHGAPALLVGAGATAERVLDALDGSRLAHLAAHGRLHATNPLFSSLLLADGPLTIYDLERLHRAPHMVVLAACDSGRSVVRAGDELLGLSATFLGLGAQTIIAPVVSVPDAETAPVMVGVHRLLREGHSAAEALARTQQAGGRDAMAASAGFVCMGADTALPDAS